MEAHAEGGGFGDGVGQEVEDLLGGEGFALRLRGLDQVVVVAEAVVGEVFANEVERAVGKVAAATALEGEQPSGYGGRVTGYGVGFLTDFRFSTLEFRFVGRDRRG